MTERTLLIVRHAKSDWAAGAPDHERPLNTRGLREAPQLGELLGGLGLQPDLVICSDATRARQTWALAASAWVDAPPVRIDARLYDASRSEVLDVINQTPDDVQILACVGHEPTSGALAAALAGSSDEGAAQTLSRGLKTASAAVITFAGTWAGLEVGAARLTAVVSPR
jgi:phosphohistidine phosphatase